MNATQVFAVAEYLNTVWIDYAMWDLLISSILQVQMLAVLWVCWLLHAKIQEVKEALGKEEKNEVDNPQV